MQAELSVSAVEWGNLDLIGALRQCRHDKDALLVKRLYVYICQRRLDSHPILGNHLVPALVECGTLSEAQRIFHSLPHRTEHSWTSLIAGFSDSGQPQHAFYLYQKMQDERSVQPSKFTYVSLLEACAKLQDAGKGQVIHAETVKRGLEKELYISSTLVDMYGKCRLLGDARLVFDSLAVRDAVTWTALIAGYAEHGLNEQVLNYFKQMKMEGVPMDAATYLCTLKACGTIGALETGRQIHAETSKSPLERDLFVGNTLIDMYSRCNSLVEGREVFNHLLVRNAVTWNTLIGGYTEHGFGEEAATLFQQMLLDGISPTFVTFVLCLQACGSTRALDTGQYLHIEIIKRGLEKDLSVGSTLIDMYSKCGSLMEAHQELQRLPVRNAVSWTALIAGYAEHGLDDEVLMVFKEMQLEVVIVDALMYVFILKACSTMGASELGEFTHSEIVKRAMEKESHLHKGLVIMYMKCGLLAEATKAFGTLPLQDTAVWNALIVHYIEQGLEEVVLNCYQQLQLEGTSPDSVTFACSLRACITLGVLVIGQELHAEVTKRGLEPDLHVASTLVDMYGGCGSLEEASQVLDKLPGHNSNSWSALFAGSGSDEETSQCSQLLQLDDAPVHASRFICSLKACGTIGASERGREIHAGIVRRGLESELFVGSTLVDMYSKCGMVAESQKVFESMPVRNTVSWTALIAGYTEYASSQEVLGLFKQMQLEGVSANEMTFVLCLKGCGASGDIKTGQEIHAEITSRGVDRELYVGSSLIDMYCKCGLLKAAHCVLERLSVRNTVSWTTLIAGYAENGMGEEVLNCFQDMQLEGLRGDTVTYVLCLKACGTIGALESGREIHAEIRKSGLERDLGVGNMLIDMYGRCGSVTEGREVFDKLAMRDVVSWTAMIKTYGENHEGNMAVQCFAEMQEQGVKPDSITYTCLLAACSHASLVLEGQEIFRSMREKHGIEPTQDHYACMVDLLARSGHIYEAERLIAAMECPPTGVNLMALLSACKMYGDLELGHRCFQHLVEVNEEDGTAYLLLADVYATTGRWSDANRIEVGRKFAGAAKMSGSARVEVN